MAAYTGPRRATSTATTVVVDASVASWLPAPAFFRNVSLANASTINPENGLGDQVYHANNGFDGTWIAYAGGAFASALGALGSMVFFSGGNGAYDGNGVVAYDIADRTWAMLSQPDNTGVYRTSTGPTSSNSTHSLDSDAVSDRVGLSGHYIKDGFGNAYAGTEVTGNSTTVWKPFPIHSLCGITYLPPDAGGGTYGSLIVVGHDMNGIRVLSANGKIFRFDLETHVWSAINFPFYQFQIEVAAEYDSFNKLLWVSNSGSNRPFVWSYLTNSGGVLNNPTINNSNNYGNLVYMPLRKIMVTLAATPPSTVTIRYLDLNGYTHGTSSPPGTSVTLTTVSSGNITGSAPVSMLINANGANDKLDYCDYDGCLYYLLRATGGTACTLYKLTPPAVGSESTGTWTWSSEPINQHDGSTTFACRGGRIEPTWGGRARYVHSLKSIIMSDSPSLPVQAIRSSSWV